MVVHEDIAASELPEWSRPSRRVQSCKSVCGSWGK